METVSFTKHSLYDFVFSERYNLLTNIPISKHRAISQINNPRANDKDIILVVQFDGNKTVGYLGILPDYIFVDSNKEKIGWLTCFWVDENYKSFNVAANLFRRVIRAWERKIFITNIVPWLEPVYQKTKLFTPTKYKIGYRGYMRFNFAELLPPKKNFFKKVIVPLRLIDSFLNIFADFRFVFFKNRDLKDVKFEYLTSVDEISEEFINFNNKNNLIQRGSLELNWIVKNPWVLGGSKKDFNSSRYYFSSLDKRFFYQIVRFSDKTDKTIGLVIIKIRNNELSVPYVFCESKNMDTIVSFIINTMMQLKLNMTTIFNEELATSLNKVKGRFILDTGASNSCVGFNEIEIFQLKTEESEHKASGAGSNEIDTLISKKNNIKIGKFKLKKTPLILIDLSHINNALVKQNASPIRGIIGADILHKGKAIIDYNKKYLYLLNKNNKNEFIR